MYEPGKFHLRLGGVAFLAGVVATLVTTFAVISRKKLSRRKAVPSGDDWEDSLGI
jgi:hypothetical protein